MFSFFRYSIKPLSKNFKDGVAKYKCHISVFWTNFHNLFTFCLFGTPEKQFVSVAICF